MQARIIGMGSYLPEKILTNAELETMVDTNDEWIVSRTGIKERRVAKSDEYTSDLGAAAATKALADAGLTVADVDLILVATITPDYISTNTAALVQNLLGAKHAAAMDIQAACTGFIYGLSTAKAFIESGMYRCILLIASEKMSSYVDYKDRGTCILFGDGASAAVITGKGRGLAIDNVVLGADGSLADLLVVPAGGVRHPSTHETVERRMHYFKMVGSEVFKHAVRRMCAAAADSVKKAGLKMEQFNWVVPHQANIRIMEAVAKGCDVPFDKVYKTVHRYGNTSASSVAIALDELCREFPPANGDPLLLVAFGAGFTWGASVLKMIPE